MTPTGARQLDPSDFSFYGVDSLTQSEERMIRRLSIRHGEPAASIVEPAIFVPSGNGRTIGQPRFSGGLLTAAGEPVDAANVSRKGGGIVGGFTEGVSVVAERQADEEVIYLGVLHKHYGRFLLESLARVWYLQSVDPSVKVEFTRSTAAQGSLSEWMLRLLAMFGMPRERILELGAPTRLRRVIVPEQLFEQHASAHTNMVLPFRTVADRIALDTQPSSQPVYLSRRLLKSKKRSIVGEGDLENLLQDNGFLIVYPETMTLEDQIRLVNTHTDIFSSLGSAAHTVLFARAKPHLHLLAKRDAMPANFFLCSALAEIPTTLINCLGSGERTGSGSERKPRRAAPRDDDAEHPVDLEPGSQSTPQLIELPTIVEYLADRGFLSSKQQAAGSVTPHAPALQDHYDEVWFYARVRKVMAKGKTLAPELERDAVFIAETSWPVSLVLADYYMQTENVSGAEGMANRFADLVASEHDSSRRNRYRMDVVRLTRKFGKAGAPKTTDRLRTVLTDCFPAEPSARDTAISREAKETAT